ncbi:Nop52-domain-containing protein [Dentipellis sp. KUC8613]|nr:Nop52-domain-containing protein [Dentipellis sp. KUC8613]
MASTSTSTEAPPLAKHLASTDKKIRDKATKNLSLFLSDPSHDALSKSEMDKLWKGIFYCFWMSDKPLVQQDLATELAEILLTITSTQSFLAFLRGFWETTVREWNGIDRLRMDKYYMLVRRFVNASFRRLIQENWDISVCNKYNDILTRKGGPLCPDDNRIPLSLTYHIADIYLEELDKAAGKSAEQDDEQAPNPVPLTVLLGPYFGLAAHAPLKNTYERVQSSVLEPLLRALSVSRSEDSPATKRRKLMDTDFEYLLKDACISDPKEEGKVDRSALRKGLLKSIFDVASEPDSRDSNRRKLYALWRSNMEEDDDDNRPVDAS